MATTALWCLATRVQAHACEGEATYCMLGNFDQDHHKYCSFLMLDMLIKYTSLLYMHVHLGIVILLMQIQMNLNAMNVKM